ncbi:MAG: hypothetical protein LBT09_06985 [Planctomycetaceae bacterium]|nr:hypothetical protein [Planctomycetaceae bacterium]
MPTDIYLFLVSVLCIDDLGFVNILCQSVLICDGLAVAGSLQWKDLFFVTNISKTLFECQRKKNYETNFYYSTRGLHNIRIARTSCRLAIG